MKIYLFLIFLLSAICFNSAPLKANEPISTGILTINWSGWTSYQNSNIFYRIQILNPDDKQSTTVAIEILNNSQQDVSFNIALNDDGLKSTFQAVKVRRKQSTIINYPKPKDIIQVFASINNLESN